MTTYPHQEPLSESQQKLLQEIYYEKGNMFGLHKLFDIVRKHQQNDDSVPRIYREQIQKWLADQHVAQRFKQPPARKDTRQIYTSKKGFIQCDVMYMPEPFNGFKYILNCVDVFSRKLWSIALKNLKSDTVTRELVKLFADIGCVTMYQVDGGAEFKDNVAGYKRIQSRPYTPQNNAMVERTHGSVRLLLGKLLLSRKTKDWVSLLPTVVENYNNSPHKGINKKTPNYVWQHGLSVDEKRKDFQSKDLDKPLEKGQKVRLRNNEKTRASMSTPNYSEEIFEIIQVIKGKDYTRNRYKIKSEDGFIQRTNYNSTELLPVNKIEQSTVQETIPRITRVDADKVTLPQREPSKRIRKLPSKLNDYIL